MEPGGESGLLPGTRMWPFKKLPTRRSAEAAIAQDFIRWSLLHGTRMNTVTSHKHCVEVPPRRCGVANEYLLSAHSMPAQELPEAVLFYFCSRTSHTSC